MTVLKKEVILKGLAPEKRRRVPRRALKRNIGLLIKGKYCISKCYELGEGGMLIESPVRLVANQLVVITLRISGLLSAVTLGRVVYLLEPKQSGEVVKYGIQFEQIDFDVKRKIRNFVASSASEFIAITEDEGAATTESTDSFESMEIEKLKIN